MSHNNLNYHFVLNNYKDMNIQSQNNINNNLFNRNNKINIDIPKPYSNKTTNNFCININQKQLSNNMEPTPVYNTYYSNFPPQGNQYPYKLSTLNYNIANISNNMYARYNPILNQIGQNNSLGNINSISSYPNQYNNSINNSISNNMTNATSSSNTNINYSNQYNNNFNEKFSNKANYSQNLFFRNNFDRRNYSSYDSQSRDSERRKKEEYSLVLKQQIEEKNKRKLLEKQKQAEEDLKYEKKYQEYLRQQEEKNLKKNIINSNLSYNIKKIPIPHKKNNNINTTEYMTDFTNKNNNSIYFNTNNNMNINPKINSINNKAININNNNINFFMLDRNQKRPITSSIAQTGLGIIGNMNNISKPIQIKNDKINFPFISQRNTDFNNREQDRNQKKNYIRAYSYNLKKSRDNKNKINDIYSIIDKVNLKGISYRSKYENDIGNEDKEKNNNNDINNDKNNENQLKNKSKLVVSKIKNKENNINNDIYSKIIPDIQNQNLKNKKNENNIKKEENRNIQNLNEGKNNTIDIEKIKKEEDNNNEMI